VQREQRVKEQKGGRISSPSLLVLIAINNSTKFPRIQLCNRSYKEKKRVKEQKRGMISSPSLLVLIAIYNSTKIPLDSIMQ
jgi:hypothetical protein